jgi:hypothetical protein
VGATAQAVLGRCGFRFTVLQFDDVSFGVAGIRPRYVSGSWDGDNFNSTHCGAAGGKDCVPSSSYIIRLATGAGASATSEY